MHGSARELFDSVIWMGTFGLLTAAAASAGLGFPGLADCSAAALVALTFFTWTSGRNLAPEVLARSVTSPVAGTVVLSGRAKPL